MLTVLQDAVFIVLLVQHPKLYRGLVQNKEPFNRGNRGLSTCSRNSFSRSNILLRKVVANHGNQVGNRGLLTS